jgi:tetratricopeptide (TPR) repeat protein
MEVIERNSQQSIQATAITAYLTALSYIPDSLETYFQLALQYAWKRDLEKSIAALSQALRVDKHHVPSIHLLALILTALGDYERALQTCHTIKFDQHDQQNLDNVIALIEMQLTYLRIVEVVSGSDLALEVQKGIFKLYSQLLGLKPKEGFIKTESNLDQRAQIPETVQRQAPSSQPTASNAGAGHVKAKSSLGGQSIDSKVSLQVPPQQSRKPRSVLKRKPRRGSADGRSLNRPPTANISENAPSSSSPMCSPLIVVVSDVTHRRHDLPTPPLPGTKPIVPITQKHPNNHGTTSKYTSAYSVRKEQIAKLYRAKLWLTCAGIYRRARQWDGAQAAIQNALLCDICPEEVFTEVRRLRPF